MFDKLTLGINKFCVVELYPGPVQVYEEAPNGPVTL